MWNNQVKIGNMLPCLTQRARNAHLIDLIVGAEPIHFTNAQTRSAICMPTYVVKMSAPPHMNLDTCDTLMELS